MLENNVPMGQNRVAINDNFTELYSSKHTHPTIAKSIMDSLTEIPPTNDSINNRFNQVQSDLIEHNTSNTAHSDIRTLANNAQTTANTSNSTANTALTNAGNAQTTANTALTEAKLRATSHKNVNVAVGTFVPIYDIDGNNFTTANQSYLVYLTALATNSNSRSIYQIDCGSNPVVTQINTSGGIINPTISVENGIVGLRQGHSTAQYTIGVVLQFGNKNTSGFGAIDFLARVLKPSLFIDATIPPSTGTFAPKVVNGILTWISE